MNLFNFAFCPKFPEKISVLATMAPEKWSFGNKTDNEILINYIEHTFEKLQQEDKILQTDSYALFNTGLFTEHYEAIYAYFTPNRNSERQKWFLIGFQTAYQLGLIGVTKNLPERANYFTDPSDLVFNTNYEIVIQHAHILSSPENAERLPASIRTLSTINALLIGAIAQAKKKIDANYKTAVPQYYRGRIQLLIPVCLVDRHIPDLALVVSKNDEAKQYMGHTCLTLDMAYNNARLIARPDSLWLVP